MFQVRSLDGVLPPPVRDPHVLVGVDGSERSVRAALWAAREAQARRLPLVLATGADDDAAPATGLNPGFSEAFFEDLHQRSVTGLDEAAAAVSAAFPKLRVERVFGWSRPSRLLCFLSRTAVMTVVGSTGARLLSRVLVGSTAMEVVGHAHSPVAVVRGEAGSGRTRGPVVVGVDGSELSAGALRTAFELAGRYRAELVAVHAGADPSHEAVVARSIDVLREEFPEVTVTTVLSTNGPSEALVHQCSDARVVVVGSRGRGEIAGGFLGSVSRHLIYHAPCPVLVNRPDHSETIAAHAR
ncbi:universal stress protein [Tsukamurella serpentis]